jgi:excisionase family DNA binding protein
VRVVDDAPVILSADEVAELLHVDRKTVYQAAQRGDIPHRRLGRRLLFERGTVLAWLRHGDLTD